MKTVPSKMPFRSRTVTVRCRGDRAYAFSPKRTALVVVDMQKDFFAPPDEDDPMREIIPRVVSLVQLARKLGCHVVHTRESYKPDLSDVSAYRKSLGYVGRKGPSGRFLVRGEPGCDFLDELQPLANETVIDKPGFSAFLGGKLHRYLSGERVDRLIICGVTTQCCVHSTLREAVDLGYWCLTVADCCAAEDEALHDAALLLIGGEGDLFGWIADLADLQAATKKRALRSAKK